MHHLSTPGLEKSITRRFCPKISGFEVSAGSRGLVSWKTISLSEMETSPPFTTPTLTWGGRWGVRDGGAAPLLPLWMLTGLSSGR